MLCGCPGGIAPPLLGPNGLPFIAVLTPLRSPSQQPANCQELKNCNENSNVARPVALTGLSLSHHSATTYTGYEMLLGGNASRSCAHEQKVQRPANSPRPLFHSRNDPHWQSVRPKDPPRPHTAKGRYLSTRAWLERPGDCKCLRCQSSHSLSASATI